MVTIVGCGGVGSNIAIKLAMNPDIDYIALIDDDIVDEKYLGRVPLVRLMVGELAIDEYKVRVLENVIGMLREDLCVKAVVGRVPDYFGAFHNMAVFDSPVLICVDSMEARREIEEFLRKAEIGFYHIGFDNHRLTVYDSVEDVIEVQERRPVEGSSYENPPSAIELDIAASYVVNKLFGVIEVIDE